MSRPLALWLAAALLALAAGCSTPVLNRGSPAQARLTEAEARAAALARSGDYAGAARFYGEALRIATSLENADAIAANAINLSIVNQWLGRDAHDARHACRASGDERRGGGCRRRARSRAGRAHRVGAARGALADASGESASAPAHAPRQAMSMAEPPRDSSHVHMRRRSKLNRRRRLARLDVGLGLLVALVLLLATPGLAIAAIVALIVLVACVISFLVQRRAARRSARQREDESPPPRARGRRADG